MKTKITHTNTHTHTHTHTHRDIYIYIYRHLCVYMKYDRQTDKQDKIKGYFYTWYIKLEKTTFPTPSFI